MKVTTVHTDLNKRTDVHFWLNPWGLKGIKNSGDTITTLTESSQNGYVGTGSGGTSTYPIYHEDSNGIPYIKFNGNQWIDFGDILDDVVHSSLYSFYIIFQLENLSGVQTFWSKYYVSTPSDYRRGHVVRYVEGRGLEMFSTKKEETSTYLDQYISKSISALKKNIFSGQFDYSEALKPNRQKMWLNLKEEDKILLADSSEGLGTNSTAPFKIGCLFSNGNTHFVNAKIYDMIITNQTYNQGITRMLQLKYVKLL